MNAYTLELLPRRNTEDFFRRKKLRSRSEIRDFKKVSVGLPAIKLITPTRFNPQYDTSGAKISTKAISDQLHQEILNKIDNNFLRNKTLQNRLKTAGFWPEIDNFQDQPFTSVDLMNSNVKLRDKSNKVQRDKVQYSLKMLQPYFKKAVICDRKPYSFDPDNFLKRRMGNSPDKIKEISQIYSSNLTTTH